MEFDQEFIIKFAAGGRIGKAWNATKGGVNRAKNKFKGTPEMNEVPDNFAQYVNPRTRVDTFADKLEAMDKKYLPHDNKAAAGLAVATGGGGILAHDMWNAGVADINAKNEEAASKARLEQAQQANAGKDTIPDPQSDPQPGSNLWDTLKGYGSTANNWLGQNQVGAWANQHIPGGALGGIGMGLGGLWLLKKLLGGRPRREKYASLKKLAADLPVDIELSSLYAGDSSRDIGNIVSSANPDYTSDIAAAIGKVPANFLSAPSTTVKNRPPLGLIDLKYDPGLQLQPFNTPDLHNDQLIQAFYKYFGGDPYANMGNQTPHTKLPKDMTKYFAKFKEPDPFAQQPSSLFTPRNIAMGLGIGGLGVGGGLLLKHLINSRKQEPEEKEEPRQQTA